MTYYYYITDICQFISRNNFNRRNYGTMFTVMEMGVLRGKVIFQGYSWCNLIRNIVSATQAEPRKGETSVAKSKTERCYTNITSVTARAKYIVHKLWVWVTGLHLNISTTQTVQGCRLTGKLNGSDLNNYWCLTERGLTAFAV